MLNPNKAVAASWLASVVVRGDGARLRPSSIHMTPLRLLSCCGPESVCSSGSNYFSIGAVPPPSGHRRDGGWQTRLARLTVVPGRGEGEGQSEAEQRHFPNAPENP